MTAILGFLASLLRPLIAPLIAYWKGRRDAATKAELEAYRETQKRVEAGRDALRNSRDGSPDDRLRRNDGDWH